MVQMTVIFIILWALVSALYGSILMTGRPKTANQINVYVAYCASYILAGGALAALVGQNHLWGGGVLVAVIWAGLVPLQIKFTKHFIQCGYQAPLKQLAIWHVAQIAVALLLAALS